MIKNELYLLTFLTLVSFKVFSQIQSHKEFIDSKQIMQYINKVGTNEGDIYTYGLYIRYTDSVSIKYKLTIGKNWKESNEFEGKALLDNESIYSNKRKIKNLNDKEVPVYSFIDDSSECNIEILISKNDTIHRTNAQILKKCNDHIKELTSPLWFK
ncbi:hypothetical protein [uncultured Aquimarina sp.]|uniref:hypothetical protein n=1 Tax=uncultured Aquimarina sp. TaxID=575652 RepID=UPI002617C005|nr:hypothetical protein [uncultured Aquimarina sp.]